MKTEGEGFVMSAEKESRFKGEAGYYIAWKIMKTNILCAVMDMLMMSVTVNYIRAAFIIMISNI